MRPHVDRSARAPHLVPTRYPDPSKGLGFYVSLNPTEAMPEETPSEGSDNSRFRTTLIRVILVQVVALGLLLLLQLRYQP